MKKKITEFWGAAAIVLAFCFVMAKGAWLRLRWNPRLTRRGGNGEYE
jgi:hypothetical protein